MTPTRIRLDDLVGRVVRDMEGGVVGRIFEIRAEEDGDALVVAEYHLGTAALLERVGITMLKLIGRAHREPIKVSWDRMDISDPDNPRLIRETSR